MSWLEAELYGLGMEWVCRKAELLEVEPITTL